MNKKKIAQCIIGAILLGIAVLVYINVHPENWLKTVGDPVSLETAAANKQTDYTGYEAGQGFVPIHSAEEFDAVLPIETNYIVVAPTKAIATGIYVKMPWWKPAFTAGTRKSYRNKNTPGVTDSALYSKRYGYCEYQVIQLPDGNYILALMDQTFAEALQKGETIILPLGRKEGKLQEAEKLLRPYLEKYNITEKYVLYTMNTELYKKNEWKVTLLRVGIAMGVFFTLTAAAVIAFKKIFSE